MTKVDDERSQARAAFAHPEYLLCALEKRKPLNSQPTISDGSRVLDSLSSEARIAHVYASAMRVRQHAALLLRSNVLDPDEITQRMALVPDEVKAMGSLHPGPPARPAAHIWRLPSGIADDHRVDDHFEALLTKLVGSAERVRALIEGAEVGGEFVIGRYFEPGPEEERIVEPGRQIGDFERLRGSTPCLTSSHARTGRLRCARRAWFRLR